ncbi:bifunctional alpha/beta hydrolase/OsmC family protein [Gramella sp. GC03-9]|uniref:Bifunctional alpha/beta hydrolase/OsmC family protein n=1 Tax=Christiangramia oceanisediminis TaxID=2920386 RepID=A0A9X2I3J2_9FLAO|nr:bifunctional alpha/beta hydrolase/OsmC family protein [Gramella oceanisediminis]MCP9200060.1 bifunctional alpha/beta hydrolase/OsmC family protein [Gramella oceanisediminis]
MEAIKVKFKNKDSQELSGVLELPGIKPPANFVIFAHCFTCNKNFHAPKNISETLASKGFGVLRFDFTGLGESEGDFPDTNFSANVEDLIAAANFLETEYNAPTIIIGHSLGGAAALFAAKKISSIKAVVTINAPSKLEHVKKHFSSSLEEISAQGYAEVKIGGRTFRIKEQFVKDLDKNQESLALKDLKKAFLILHSPQDEIVSIQHAEELYTAAWHPKSFISLQNSDHLLSKADDARYAGKLIAAWSSKYVIEPATRELETDHEVMANLGKEGFTTHIVAGNHHFVADEPKSAGGSDLGPNPYELLSAALAACTSMTLQMYARRKKWVLDNVETHVNHSKKHPVDCENCEKDSAKIDQFEREILIHGQLDNAQKNRLLEIADKCPVHKSLEAQANINTKLISPED